MASVEELRTERIKKLQELKATGMDPFPAESNATTTNGAFLTTFVEGAEATLVGRIMSMRHIGAIAFAQLFDGTDRVQVVFHKETTSDFALGMATLEMGDFIEVKGAAMVTKTGAQSLGVTTWRMLAKSLQAMPTEHFGIKDEDERYRKRYLDMLLDENVRNRVRRRSIFWNTIRSFLLARDYTEVHTPILETKTGGAEARPFITHHNALDIDVFLRISHELWHKKIIAGGIPKVFEIGQVFRNEGMSHEHAQDYVHMELYEAFSDARKGVPMIIDMYRTAAQATWGTTQFTINGHEVDLAAEWGAYDYNELMQNRFGFDPRTVTLDVVRAKLDEEGITYDDSLDVGRGVDTLWKLIRKTLGGPAILTGMPVYLEPLAKKNATDPRVVDRFQIILGGSEVGKAFNELNDPLDQRERFEHQQSLRDKGDDEAQMADWEYVEAMEYGMPPMFGFGVSERLFAFLEGVSIREGQIFPLMKPKVD
ncbi:hypothetical protein A3C87_01800 [Candidatus Kaiserbacteria bacterium RIFCSPHIGHO2_02_FULL_49_34]|uniref:Aminoacyl-transfer RNA synthetases class-II family profile domain-containing protein n=1 Tax=Candidatus Kaiserbacteria bacterium RIFCSPHIGHO2_02_FULL_49_34 TaxID=1798491 RepID=A0A1F6DLB5_9BACT|nr:MAG: hypothetical protein A3C87_01800 [Candidatus Kaiserbacteria bacterium RIFCSPHIGHO2_02_FULL_49_34]